MFSMKAYRVGDPHAPGRKCEDYWPVAQRLLSDPGGFINRLLQFDKDNIPENVIRRVEPYIDSEDLSHEVQSKISRLGPALCFWIRAMYKYYHVAKEVEPIRRFLAESEVRAHETE